MQKIAFTGLNNAHHRMSVWLWMQKIAVAEPIRPSQGEPCAHVLTLEVLSGSNQDELAAFCVQERGVMARNPAIPTKLLLLPTLVVCLVGQPSIGWLIIPRILQPSRVRPIMTRSFYIERHIYVFNMLFA